MKTTAPQGYPKVTTDGYNFPDQQHEALSMEVKTYANGSKSIRIKLTDGTMAMLRKLTEKEQMQLVKPGISSIKRSAAIGSGKENTGSGYVENAVLILACTRFDGQLIEMETLLMMPFKDWISLEAAAFKIHAE